MWAIFRSQKVQKLRLFKIRTKSLKVLKVSFLIKKSEYIKTFKQKRLTVHRVIIHRGSQGRI
jgi:hypothetical protein